MKLHPDPMLNLNASEELEAASKTWLSDSQYKYLLNLEQETRPVSRVAFLMNLVFEPGQPPAWQAADRTTVVVSPVL